MNVGSRGKETKAFSRMNVWRLRLRVPQFIPLPRNEVIQRVNVTSSDSGRRLRSEVDKFWYLPGSHRDAGPGLGFVARGRGGEGVGTWKKA